MKIIRITGDRGMGKTTYLRTLQRSPDTDFIDLTNCSVRAVEAALAEISRDPSEMRMTVLIDDCRPEVEAILRSAKCGNAVAVIVGMATDGVWSVSGAERDVLAERRRQILVEGWDANHDDTHDSGELALAGAGYSFNAGCQLNPHSTVTLEGEPFFWPTSWDPASWKPKTPREDLVRAGALILAEIERLDRQESRT